MEYIDLHIHTCNTVGNGITNIINLVKRAKEFKMKALTITDSGSIEGFNTFNTECLKEGIKPIFACGFYLAPLGLNKTETHHLVLIAKDNIGLNNIRKLNDFSFSSGLGIKPRVDFDIVNKYSSNIYCLTGGLGGVYDKPFLQGNSDLALSNILKLKKIFNDSLFLEIQNNELDNNRVMQAELQRVSFTYNIPTVISGGSFYLKREDYIKCNKLRVKSGNKELKGSGFYFKSSKCIYSNFLDNKVAIKNSVLIGNSCNVDYQDKK